MAKKNALLSIQVLSFNITFDKEVNCKCKLSKNARIVDLGMNTRNKDK